MCLYNIYTYIYIHVYNPKLDLPEFLKAFPKELQVSEWDERVRRVEHGQGEYAPNERPFASPYYWAAYAVFGDGSVSGKLQKVHVCCGVDCAYVLRHAMLHVCVCVCVCVCMCVCVCVHVFVCVCVCIYIYIYI